MWWREETGTHSTDVEHGRDRAVSRIIVQDHFKTASLQSKISNPWVERVVVPCIAVQYLANQISSPKSSLCIPPAPL